MLTRTAGYLHGYEAVSEPDHLARRLVGLLEQEADRVRWLEARDLELRTALAHFLVA